MKKLTIRQLLPILMIFGGIIFGGVGFLRLGFWNKIDGPMPGFFPTIMAIVIIAMSFLDFLQSLKETKKTIYKKEEVLVIMAGIGIFIFTFLIGLIPTIFIYVVIWLRFFERENWRNICIVLFVVGIISIGIFKIWLGISFPIGMFKYIV